MPDDDRDDDPERRRLVELIFDRLLTVLFVAAVGVVAGVTLLASGIPRQLKLGGYVALVGLVFGYVFAGPRLRAMLPEPDWEYLVDLEVTDTSHAALYQLPPGDLEDWEVTKYSLDNPNGNLYFGKDVDFEEQTVAGTWRGAYSDRELLSELTNITLMRENLQEDAEKGFKLRRFMPVVLRGRLREEAQHIQQAVEDWALPDGTTIQEAVDELVEDADDFDETSLDGLDPAKDEEDESERPQARDNDDGIDQPLFEEGDGL